MDTKSIVAVCCLLLLLPTGQTLAESGQREQCIKRLAGYVAEARIEPPVRTLIAKSRHFYRDASQLIAEAIPGDEYVRALREIGSQYGCEDIQQHISRMADQVECYARLQLDMDDETTLDVVRTSKQAGEVFEAYFVCNTADDE